MANYSINAFEFPDSFCAKLTHVSGGVVIVRRTAPSRQQIENWLHMSNYLPSQEKNCKYLALKAVVEPRLFDQNYRSNYGQLTPAHVSVSQKLMHPDAEKRASNIVFGS